MFLGFFFLYIGDKVLTLIVPQCREGSACLNPKGNFCEKQELVDLSIFCLSFHFLLNRLYCASTDLELKVFISLFTTLCVWVAAVPVCVTAEQHSTLFRINAGWHKQVHLQRRKDLSFFPHKYILRIYCCA